MAPMLVPVTQCTGTRSSSNTLSTPTWARPRAPPPESTSPTRGARCASAEPRTQSMSASASVALVIARFIAALVRGARRLLDLRDPRLDHAPERVAAQPLESTRAHHQRTALAFRCQGAEIELGSGSGHGDEAVHRVVDRERQ